ncbi:MAG: ribosomal RNA small subunit methyltransferase A [Acidobacteria bacterium]|nr:ribosomal RNA small subunit methyltransferase A [Acidobacteriota bacterium]MBI3656416.1 ribosomal RNA small subunit methyltransferase A [Acidobacteriota bacterium]
MAKVNHPKKAYGQHFLTNTSISRRIVQLAEPKPDDVFLEIGPGTGALTTIMADTGVRLIAVEVDQDLVAHLRNFAEPYPALKIVQANILAHTINELLREAGVAPCPVRILGNLPYNIATRIIQHLLEDKESVRDMTIMVQKEMADRLMAKPNTKAYGFLAALVQYQASIRHGFAVAPGSFFPAPKVWSAVIQLETLSPIPCPAADYQLYVNLLKAAFAHRRKTILNNLKRSSRFQPNAVAALQACAISAENRAESLPVPMLIKLANCFHALEVSR